MDNRFLHLARCYPSVFQIDNYQQYFQQYVEKTTKYSKNSFISPLHIENITDCDNYAKVGNIRVKRYVDGSADILVCSDDIFKTGRLYEKLMSEKPTTTRGCCEDEYTRSLNLERALEMREYTDEPEASPASSLNNIRRARARLRELLLSNEFDWFVTVTLDSEKVDRYDYGAIIKPLNKWLDNRVQRHGFRYILVPEFHEDGAIHFHGVVSGDLKAVDSGTVKVHGKKKPVKLSTYKRYYSGQAYSTVFNIADWRHGFTTAVRLDKKTHAVANYISKYITKDSRKVGGRWYLSGGDLKRPEPEIFRGDFFDFAQVFKMFGIEGRPERFCAFRVANTGEVFGTFAGTDEAGVPLIKIQTR